MWGGRGGQKVATESVGAEAHSNITDILSLFEYQPVSHEAHAVLACLMLFPKLHVLRKAWSSCVDFSKVGQYCLTVPP